MMRCVYVSSNHAVHQRAISVLCNLLYNHDLDVRYTDPQIKVSSSSRGWETSAALSQLAFFAEKYLTSHEGIYHRDKHAKHEYR